MKILVVDDTKTIRHILSGILSELGYQCVVTAESMEIAVQVLSKESFNLVISDWYMPGGTGMDLLKHMRSKSQLEKIPFVMLTSEGDKKKIFDAIKAGLQSYIIKPVNKEVLRQKLYELAAIHGFPPPESRGEKQEKAAEERLIEYEIELKLENRFEVKCGDKTLESYKGQNISDRLPKEFQALIPELRIAILGKDMDIALKKKLLEKNLCFKVVFK